MFQVLLKEYRHGSHFLRHTRPHLQVFLRLFTRHFRFLQQICSHCMDPCLRHIRFITTNFCYVVSYIKDSYKACRLPVYLQSITNTYCDIILIYRGQKVKKIIADHFLVFTRTVLYFFLWRVTSGKVYYAMCNKLSPDQTAPSWVWSRPCLIFLRIHWFRKRTMKTQIRLRNAQSDLGLRCPHRA